MEEPGRDLETEGAAMLREALALITPDLPPGARLVRAAMHLRGEQAYRALVIVDAPGAQVEGGPGDLVASASAWDLVRRLDHAVTVDVHMGELRELGQEGEPAQRLPGQRMTGESQELFLSRGATHVLALPARVAGRPTGMVTVELHWLAAIGQPVPLWLRHGLRLQALVDRRFPLVIEAASRPLAPFTDPDLPVVGRAMAPVVTLLRMVARFDDTVLLTGPSGAGKSMLARWLHLRSRRAQATFEHVHLQNYPETLIEGELFGWKRGAHDGARSDRDGHLARAEGGTLFLDEIDKASLGVQRKLLHLLESRAWRPLGSSAPERVADLRFVIGSNADLDAEVAAGRFLPDLLWRIRTVPVRLPGLDERQDEVKAWAEFFLQRKHRKETGNGEARFSQAALELLTSRGWPGNLRQLEQAVVRAWLVCADVEQPGALYIDSTSMRTALDFDQRAGQPALDQALRIAAAAFRRELVHRQGEGTRPLTLDDADAFRGYVLAELEGLFGLEEAFRLLGLEKQVLGRNHHATFKRELKKIDRLWE